MMNDQPTACPFCHKKVLTKRGLRQHINQSLKCSKKELEDLQKDDRGHETAFDYMEMDNGPTSSTKRVRYCGNVRYELGKTGMERVTGFPFNYLATTNLFKPLPFS